MLLSSSKVSVIPHDLFYYPHYNVPISAVLDAYVEPCLKRYDTENDISFSETVTDSLHEEGAPAQDYKEDAPEPGLQNNHGVPSLEMGTENGEEETIDMNSHSTSFYEKEVPLLIGEIEIEIDSQKATGNEDSMILQHPEVIGDNLDDFATVGVRLEESSNGDEKKENMIKVEELQTSEVGHTALLDDELEEIANSQELTRTCDSDSNIYLRKRFPDTAGLETSGKKDQKMTEVDENLLIIGMKKDMETNETAAPPRQTPSVEQSELFYLIIFLWVLVYCLLVLPQLFSFKV